MILIALGGGLGALIRYLVDTAVNTAARRRWPKLGLPLGTALINITGSLLLGLFAGWLMFRTGDASWKLAIGTGLLGGFTTFSTASVEAARLIIAGRWQAAIVHALGMMIAALGAAGLGVWLTS